jgi:predicted hotdog family 3-hydroxylacyl-ACP dehydratase
MTLERAAIERCVPHAGAMLLLDSVAHWDASHIVCSAAAPGAQHPLAREGAVPALAAVEYGAQAAAVHGFLLERPAVPRPGMLAKLSGVQLHSACIPADRGALSVNAQLLSRVAQGCLYHFQVVCAGEPVAHGRLMVAFAAPASQ